MERGIIAGFFLPIVLRCSEWTETWRAAGENDVFPGTSAEWTANQRRLVAITKEYASAFSALAMRKHDPPGMDVLGDYKKFQRWFSEYIKDPEGKEDPYKKYSRGFRTK